MNGEERINNLIDENCERVIEDLNEKHFFPLFLTKLNARQIMTLIMMLENWAANKNVKESDDDIVEFAFDYITFDVLKVAEKSAKSKLES